MKTIYRIPPIGRRVGYNTQALTESFNDGVRVILVNINGNVMFDGTVALIEWCFEKGYFSLRPQSAFGEVQ